MDNTKTILDQYGKLGVHAIKSDIEKVSATGKSAASVRYEVDSESTSHLYSLKIFGRKFIKAIETGRGPRKNSDYQEFDVSMLEYMQARGIGADLSEKKKKQLAKFLAYKINKEGDSTYKSGGRNVYSKTLDKFVLELIEALKKDKLKEMKEDIKNIFK